MHRENATVNLLIRPTKNGKARKWGTGCERHFRTKFLPKEWSTPIKHYATAEHIIFVMWWNPRCCHGKLVSRYILYMHKFVHDGEVRWFSCKLHLRFSKFGFFSPKVSSFRLCITLSRAHKAHFCASFHTSIPSLPFNFGFLCRCVCAHTLTYSVVWLSFYFHSGVYVLSTQCVLSDNIHTICMLNKEKNNEISEKKIESFKVFCMHRNTLYCNVLCCIVFRALCVGIALRCVAMQV